MSASNRADGPPRPPAPRRDRNWRLIALLIAVTATTLFVAANAHLVYVAFATRPDCVPHPISANEDGRLRAARPVC